MLMAILNGALLPAYEATLAVQDAGVVFGATVTDYCRTFNQRLFRYPLHLERLRRDCAACFVPLAFDDPRLVELAESLLCANIQSGEELALVTFATPGPLASMGGSGGPTLAMHTFPIPTARYRPFFAEGVRLHPFDGEPVFPTAKHRSRLHWWRAAHLVPDVPLLVADGTVCETALGNVLLARGDEIVAAPSPLILDGVSQRLTRDCCAPLRWREERFTVADCLTADEVLLVGSAFGIAPVSHLGGIARPWGGPVYRRLQAAWNELTGADIPEQFLLAPPASPRSSDR